MKLEEWAKYMRKPMKTGGEFYISNRIIVNEDKEQNVGKGSSCLVYHGKEEAGVQGGQEGGLERKVIVKEFYPKAYAEKIVRQENGSLQILDGVQEESKFKQCKEQFFQGFFNQRKLSNSNAMEIVVKPLSGIEKWGDSYYVVSDIHQGKDLSKVKFTSLKKKLKLVVKLSEVFSILHKEKCIMLDIKPENFMWIENPDAVRILDKDSILSIERSTGHIFFNERYQAPEVNLLIGEDAIYSEEEWKKKYLKPRINVYALGIYFYELFFEYPKDKQQLGKKIDVEKLSGEFIEIYKSEVEETKLESVAKSVIKILKNMTVSGPNQRWSIDKVQKAFEQIYFLVASEHLVLRKEHARANSSFAAYNLLQEYPLFQYGMTDQNGYRKINVALFGNHAMRYEMLSTIISIGQMLDTRLNIYIAAEDVKEFWSTYPAKGESHEVFESAVLLEDTDGTKSDKYDRHLVAEPLAKIYLLNVDVQKEGEQVEKKSMEEALSKVYKEYQCDYFIFMCEQGEENRELLRKMEECKNGDNRKTFVAYVNEEAEKKEERERYESKHIKTFSISTFCFSEKYNEDMFKTKIYKMGLMAHAYYNGYMEENNEPDEEAMKKLEKDFRGNIYNVASSERCALHGIYKMASVGIWPDRPGKVLKYFRQIEKEDVRNELAYLEHLSWTAYMLTTGVLPVDVKKLDEYAYKEVPAQYENIKNVEYNDWKEKRGGQVIHHPLLVSSSIKRGLPKENWDTISREQVEPLDDLDKVSYEIYLWYKKNKTRFYQKFEEDIKKVYEAYTEVNKLFDDEKQNQILKLLDELKETGVLCIQEMCNGVFSQNRTNVKKCKNQIEQIKESLESCDMPEAKGVIYKIEEISQMLSPVFDSYKNRDFKQADEDLIWASLDLLG